MIECRIIHALNKVFMDAEPKGKTISKASALQGETYSFQLAYRSDRKHPKLALEIESPLKEFIRVRRIVPVAVENDCSLTEQSEMYSEYERLTPGLYPDILREELDLLHTCCNVWYSLWVDIAIPENCKAGKYPICLTLVNAVPKDSSWYDPARTEKFELEVIDAKLPAQTLRHTEWFYNDCICHAHRVDAWSEEHWVLLEKYFKTFVSHGINMLLTPIFTPSLDTAVGHERLTTQLIGVKVTGKDSYAFDFSRLERWISLAEKCGVKYFEMAHLFTQWGAKACPKIIAEVDGKEKNIFGWNVKSTSRKYRLFLDAFLPELRTWLSKRKLEGKCYFHISDEPVTDNVEYYAAAFKQVEKHLEGFKIIDALSHPEFYTRGYVKLPVPSECELEQFIPLDISERWTYYCGGPVLPYSNRLHIMPAYANRIMGLLLYVYNLDGFLHWGFNFWNSGLSTRFCDPLRTENDWDYAPGDGALVYPGADGPLDSMRMEVFFHGLQDLRALRLLESLCGRAAVLRFIEKEAGGKVTMKDFPHSMEWLAEFRLKLNKKIKGKLIS